MSTSASVIRDTIAFACRDGLVALAAAVDPTAWASVTVPRVFIGSAGFLAGRNRGRLPFLDIHIEKQDFQQDTQEGGTLKSTVTISCHDTGRDQDTTISRMEQILCACLSAIRDNSNDNYTFLGSNAISGLAPGPFGWRMDATVTIEHSYAQDTFEAT